MFRRPYPTSLSALVAILAITSVLAAHFLWYYHFKNLDIVMHFVGGFWLGATTLWVYFFSSHFASVPPEKRTFKHILTIALVGALLIGLLWEAYEFGVDMFTGVRVWNATDTASDVFFDAFGAFIAAGYFLKSNYHHA